MKIGKSLAATAVSGIVLGMLVGCGGDKPADAKAPTTDTTAAPAAKGSCSANGGAATPAAPGSAAAPATEHKGSCGAK